MLLIPFCRFLSRLCLLFPPLDNFGMELRFDLSWYTVDHLKQRLIRLQGRTKPRPWRDFLLGEISCLARVLAWRVGLRPALQRKLKHLAHMFPDPPKSLLQLPYSKTAGWRAGLKPPLQPKRKASITLPAYF